MKKGPGAAGPGTGNAAKTAGHCGHGRRAAARTISQRGISAQPNPLNAEMRSLRPVHPHAMRHTMATRMVEEKVPLNIVQGILGHSSIETTRKYLHKNEAIERAAVGMMTNYLEMSGLESAAPFRGARTREKFTDIRLPNTSAG